MYYSSPYDEKSLLELGCDASGHMGVRPPYINANNLFQMASGPGWIGMAGGSGK